MKNRSFLLLAILLIGGSFAFLLVRLTALEREVNRQREQIGLMRERAGQAREAFDRMQSQGPHTTLLHYFTDKAHYVRVPVTTEATKRLDGEIEMLEKVSKER